MSILAVNLLFSTLVFWIAARLYLEPRLHQRRAGGREQASCGERVLIEHG